MVKLKIIILSLICLISCSSLINSGYGTIPKELRSFFNVLIIDPSVIFRIRNDYPKLLNDSLCTPGLTNNNNLSSFIKNFYYCDFDNCKYQDLSFVKIDSSYYYHSDYSEYFKQFNIKQDELYQSYLESKKGKIEIIWLYRSNNYYIFHITSYSVFKRMPRDYNFEE